jgi:hypothetical protein
MLVVDWLIAKSLGSDACMMDVVYMDHGNCFSSLYMSIATVWLGIRVQLVGQRRTEQNMAAMG